MPVLFMQQSPNHLVALFHDDMLGHWSSLEFEKEQVRLFKIFTNWREQQHQFATDQIQRTNQTQADRPITSSQAVKSQLLFLGGDVHSIGYTSIYPYSYRHNSIDHAYLSSRKRFSSKQNLPPTPSFFPTATTSSHSGDNFLGNKPLDTLHALTISPIQQEGLDALWLYSLVGFQHSYPFVNDNDDMLLLSNNGLYHTCMSSYFKLMLYLENYLGQVLHPTLFNIVNQLVSFVHHVIQETMTFILLIWGRLSTLITPQLEHDIQFTKSGFKIRPDGKQVEGRPRLNEPYFYGYNHYSWVNTNGYAVLTLFSPHFRSPRPSTNSSSGPSPDLLQVCIQSEIFVQARPLEQDRFMNIYQYYSSNTPPNQLQLPTLWSRFPRHNTTGIGC